MNKRQKHKVQKKLEEMTDKVAKRGLYVATKDGQYFKIIEALRGDAVLLYIPTIEHAEEFCERLNRPSNKKVRAKMSNFKKAQRHINRLADLYNEIRSYQHIINKSDDRDYKFTAETRIFETRIKANTAKRDILKQI